MKEVCPSLCNACALNKEMEKRRREVTAQGGNPSKKRNLKYDSENRNQNSNMILQNICQNDKFRLL